MVKGPFVSEGQSHKAAYLNVRGTFIPAHSIPGISKAPVAGDDLLANSCTRRSRGGCTDERTTEWDRAILGDLRLG